MGNNADASDPEVNDNDLAEIAVFDIGVWLDAYVINPTDDGFDQLKNYLSKRSEDQFLEIINGNSALPSQGKLCIPVWSFYRPSTASPLGSSAICVDSCQDFPLISIIG